MHCPQSTNLLKGHPLTSVGQVAGKQRGEMVGGNITESLIQRAGREIVVVSSGCKFCSLDSAGPRGLCLF